MPDIIIENPVINSPFDEPKRHFRFTDDGITDEITPARRISEYFVPIPPSRKKGKQAQIAFNEWTNDRREENRFINRVRDRVSMWRDGGYAGVTRTTGRLLEQWTDTNREPRLFFCQIEALETIIYINEVSSKFGDKWIENDLERFNQSANPLLNRTAFKMATGSGKTVVMAMLIAWQALNKLANPKDARFSDTFLIITPGITIKDRLRVLLPSDPDNYYKHWDIAPRDMMEQLGRIKVVITNYHAFLQREKVSAGKVTKAILNKDSQESAFKESPDEMVRRVCRELGNKKNIVVINDESHHCYRRRVEEDEEKLSGEDKKEAAKREQAARVWISGIEAVKKKIGVRRVYDLSATPFFLRGSGYSEGTLFPWVVSDFSLIDAIECGIVKVPRVPVADNTMKGDMPTYRELWLRIRDNLPKAGRGKSKLSGEPTLPKELEGALRSLYDNYQKYYDAWEADKEAQDSGNTPPVFIVICNNTSVSKLVYDYIAGWEKQLSEEESVVVPGKLPIFNNEFDRGWNPRPNTVLIDSEQLESGDAMSKDFKIMARAEIEEFKDELRRRFPGRSVDDVTDEDLLREVMNTVGKRGKLGENIKCVVSVSMLTEGWDANTVTHILGVRAFSTQLLCEQVVGRGLRRRSYATVNREFVAGGEKIKIETFAPEYAEVYGVPFSFIPTAGSGGGVSPVSVTRVRALEERADREIKFPRVIGYRYEMPQESLTANFNDDSRFVLTTEEIATKTQSEPIVGAGEVHTLESFKDKRPQEIAFQLAKLTLDRYFRDEQNNERPWLFPDLVRIAKEWVDDYVYCKSNTFKGLLLFTAYAHDAADKIYQAIVRSTSGEKKLLPILSPYEFLGSTEYVDFTTAKPVFATDSRKCHLSHVVADTGSWEQKMAQVLEDMPEVDCYVKNQGLVFRIPYTIEGRDRNYEPDFIVRIDDGKKDKLNLIIEVSGEPRKDKQIKVSTARNMWVPAINNQGTFGRWAFVEITDPWDAENVIRSCTKENPLTPA